MGRVAYDFAGESVLVTGASRVFCRPGHRPQQRECQAMIRNPIPRPNGARCAASIAFDMAADSLIRIAHPTDGHGGIAGCSHDPGPVRLV